MKPKSVVFTIERSDNPFTQTNVIRAKEVALTGIVSFVNEKSKFTKEPAPGWLIDKKSIGVFRIVHSKGDTNFSISLNIEPYFMTTVTESTIIDFTVEIKNNKGELVDKEFSFTFCPL